MAIKLQLFRGSFCRWRFMNSERGLTKVLELVAMITQCRQLLWGIHDNWIAHKSFPFGRERFCSYLMYWSAHWMRGQTRGKNARISCALRADAI